MDPTAMPEIQTGLRAENPMSFLVAIGALEILASHEDRAARLVWRSTENGWRGALLTSTADDTAGLAEVLFNAIQANTLRGLREVAQDLNRVDPSVLRQVLEATDDTGVRRVLGALVAEMPLTSNGFAAMTPMCITSFHGRRSVFGAIVGSDDDLRPWHLLPLLVGEWRGHKGVATLGWDPAMREQDSARMGPDASADGTRGVPGALQLAIRGLHACAPLPCRGRRPRVAAVDGSRFIWPIWDSPLRSFGVRNLMGRRWSDVPRPELDACGVRAVYAAEIVPAKNGRRLAQAHALA